MFIDFPLAFADLEPTSDEAIARVVMALTESVAEKTIGQVAAPKLAAVFRERAKSGTGFGFQDVLNFAHVVAAKGSNWEKTAELILARCGRQAYYLWTMSNILIRDIKLNVSKAVDVEKAKRLLVYIQVKRQLSKQHPSSTAVTRAYKQLAGKGFFEEVLSENPIEQIDEETGD